MKSAQVYQPSYDEYHLESINDLPYLEFDVDDLDSKLDLDPSGELEEIAINLRLPNTNKLFKRQDEEEIRSKLRNHMFLLLEARHGGPMPELSPELKNPKRVYLMQRITYADAEENTPFVNGYADGLSQEGEPEDEFMCQIDYKNGKKDGLQLCFRDNKLESKTPYKKGLIHGVVEEFDQNGKYSIQYYLDDRKVSKEAYLNYLKEIITEISESTLLIPDVSRITSEYLI